MKHRLKYLLPFLTSVALTFHFLQSRSLDDEARRTSSKHGWTVLAGNVTVHIGVEARNVVKSVFKVNAEKLCSSYDTGRARVLIFVASKTENFARRQAIRDTWAIRALQDALNFRVAFIVGKSDGNDTKKVKDESFRYGDVVQSDIPESFRNLGRKSVTGLFWSAKYCNEADFIVKTDDDIYIHVPNLLDAIRSAKDPDNLLLCRENRKQRILRKELKDKVPKNYDKYEVTELELPGVYYPPYCSGMAYVMSRSVRGRLLQASLITPLFFIEDVYLTGFCRYKAGIEITPHSGITLRPPIEPVQASCVFREGRITSHELGVDELHRLWAETNTQGFFCPQFLGYARMPLTH